MEVPLALLADSANISENGKLNVLGAFTQIGASSFPALHMSMSLVLQLQATQAEYGQEKSLQLKMLDADGGELGTLKMDFEVPTPANPSKRPNLYTIFNIGAATFMKPGDHVIHVLIGGEDKRQIPFELVHLSDSATQEDVDEDNQAG